MTPETIDGLTNAWVWADTQIRHYGPGLGVAAGAGALWWTTTRAPRLARRITTRHGIRRLEHHANSQRNRSPRKETDQP